MTSLKYVVYQGGNPVTVWAYKSQAISSAVMAAHTERKATTVVKQTAGRREAVVYMCDVPAAAQAGQSYVPAPPHEA